MVQWFTLKSWQYSTSVVTVCDPSAAMSPIRGVWVVGGMAGVDAQQCVRRLQGTPLRGQILKIKEVGVSCY